jgi:hypothetical protein
METCNNNGNQNLSSCINDVFEGFNVPSSTTDNETQVIPLGNGRFAVGFWLFESVSSKDKESPPRLKCQRLYDVGVFHRLSQLGFYKRPIQSNFMNIRETCGIIEMVEICQMQDVFYREAVCTIDESLSFNIGERTYTFLREDLINIYLKCENRLFKQDKMSYLPSHTKKLLRDDRQTSWLCYNNCVVKVTASGQERMSYDDLGDCVVWRSHIIDRNFDYISDYKGCHFERFLWNIVGAGTGAELTQHTKDRMLATMSSIGYLLHNYNNSDLGKAVILYDEKSTNETKNGGTGKGVLVNAIRQVRNVQKIDGKMFRTDYQFRYQGVTNETQLVWVDDVTSKFPFEDLYSKLTDGWVISRKNLTDLHIAAVESPKVVISSNTVLNTVGSSNKRRQQILEFSDHYSQHLYDPSKKDLPTEHGCIFFSSDWSESEWNMFDSVMVDCLRYYLKNGLQTYEHICVERNVLAAATCSEFVSFMLDEAECPIQIGVEFEAKPVYDMFVSEFVPDMDLKQRTFTVWVRKYAEMYNLILTERGSNGKRYYKLTKK